ncbi:3-deoxy-manno-octulosonate cytidylyltransferase [bacterium]|nr:3-deoxy-manno-octulosonate cytidylyltransferase [bacterium]
MTKTVAIIPARYGSVRFPGKVLADLCGKPVVQHVYERVVKAKTVSRAVVATDDERIARAVSSFGGEAVMTSPHHVSGTDRVAEAASITGGDIIVNVQGDEPLIDPDVIDRIVEKITVDREISCSTAASPISDETVYLNPNAVKVVIDHRGRALYFSRSPVPYYRDGGYGGGAYIHMGIYCFRRSFLDIYSSLEPTGLEKAEKLEQLRIIEHGYLIGVIITAEAPKGIDIEEDLRAVRERLKCL